MTHLIFVTLLIFAALALFGPHGCGDEEPPAEPDQTPGTNDTDSGRDVDELKHMIKMLQDQTQKLVDELHKKEPEKPVPPDYGAYFAEIMGKKLNERKEK